MTNKQIVEKMYESLSRKDADGINACYAEEIIYNDPVFGLVQGAEVRAMWKMRCKHLQHFTLSFDGITEIDHEYLTCNWTADYIFNATGRHIHNRVRAFIRIMDGKVIEHSDAFRLSRWIGQAFGLKGKLFGWTNVMKKSVQKKAGRELSSFIRRETNSQPGSTKATVQ